MAQTVATSRSTTTLPQVVFVFLAVGALGVFVVWMEHDGGYAPEQWLPGTLVLLGLLATASVSASARRRLSVAWLPVTLLTAYACFSYLTIAWAGARGTAVDGANRTALYAVAFVLFVALAEGSVRSLMPPAWAACVIVVGLVHFFRAASAQGPRGFFIEGRLATPVKYPDAAAAVFLMAALTLMVVAARRESPLWVRGAAGGLACAGTNLAVLAQSRGSLIALPLAVVAWLFMSRSALRTLLALTLVTAAVAPATPVLLDVYRAVINGSGYASTLAHARTVMLVSAVAGIVGFTCIGLLDRHVTVPSRVTRVIGRALAAGGVLAGAGAIVVTLVFFQPVSRLDRAWTNLTTNHAAPPETIHLASGVGTSRYDVWRIALRQFVEHPVGGVGADNYLAGYLRERRTVETARYPESVVLRALSETGVVGALLFFGFLASVIAALIRRIRREPPLGAAVVAAVPATYWLLHGSVDWFWEFPALTGPALAFMALAILSSEPVARDRPKRVPSALVSAASMVGGAALSVVVFSCWVSVRKIDLATKERFPTDAYALLADAARWNPLSDDPQLTEAAVAANVLDRRREVAALHAALRKNGEDWYAHLMLGIAAGREGRLRLSSLELRKARTLSPLEPVVIYAQDNLRVGNALTEAEIAQVFAIRSRTLRGVTQR